VAVVSEEVTAVWVTARMLESDVFVAAAKKRRTCDRFDEVGDAIPRVERRRQRRCAGHYISSSSCDYVTTLCVTTLLVSDISVVTSVLVMVACEQP
jgi:hypothetical protein